MTRDELIEVMARAITEVSLGGPYPSAERMATAALAALEAANVRPVPVELTEMMAAEMECQFSTEGQWEAALAASPYAPPGD